MITVKTKDYHKILLLQCDAGDASITLYTFSKFNPKHYKDSNGKVCIELDMRHIDEINALFGQLDVQREIDKSFIEWKEKYRNKVPLAIRIGVTQSRIIRSCDYEVPKKEIDEVCKYFFNAAVNMPSYKDKKWDGYFHLFDVRTKTFYTGLLDRVIGVLNKLGIPYKLQYLYELNPPRQFDWKPKDLFTPSSDQELCVQKCLETSRGVVKAATGFGKTSMLARYLTAYRGVPTLFIANKKVLLDDAAKDFAEGIEGLDYEDIAQIKDGWFGSTKITSTTKEVNPIDKPIVVATIQSLSARLKDKRTRGTLLYWLQNVCKFLMVDETQAVGSEIWDEVLSVINAPYRIFLSATPKRTDGATLKIFAYAGPLLFGTSAEEQIEAGRLCDVNIEYHPFDHGLYNENDRELNYSQLYSETIVHNDKRNSFLVDKALEMIKEDRQVLMLIQSIEHGSILKEILLEKGLKPEEVRYIWGQSSNKQRVEAIEEFRNGQYKVLIGSTIADAGLNIPSISGVVLCGAGGSDITHIQRIGRGSRIFDYVKNWGYEPKFIKENNGKKITRIIDVVDINVAFFKKQSKKRFYNAREEFGKSRVHIIGDTEAIFKFKSRKTEDRLDINDQEEIQKMFAVFEQQIRQVNEEKIDGNVEKMLSDWGK